MSFVRVWFARKAESAQVNSRDQIIPSFLENMSTTP